MMETAQDVIDEIKRYEGNLYLRESLTNSKLKKKDLKAQREPITKLRTILERKLENEG